MKAGHQRKDEGNMRRDFESRQPSRPDVTPEKPSSEGEPFQTTKNPKTPNNCPFNANIRNGMNGCPTDPQSMIDAESLKSELHGAKI